ncbi:MAG TPA: cytochrome c family protein [Myxococcales bacterium]|nr:cytochrome c family protein [Myxococcales bacterium]
MRTPLLAMLGLAVLVLGAVLWFRSRHQPAERTLSLIFAADQLGYLSPCGCSEHQLGGAARAAAFLEQASAAAPTLFVEGGNLLFGSLHPAPEEQEQFREKAVALAASWERGAAGAARSFSLGPFDEALGDEFARRTLGAEPILEHARLVELAGAKIGLLPLAAGQTSTAAELRSQGADVVLGIAQAPKVGDALGLGAAAGVDLVLQAGVVNPVEDTDEAALLEGRLPAFRVKDKGRSLLELTLHLVPGQAGGLLVPEPMERRRERAADLDRVLASDRARLASAEGPVKELLVEKIRELQARKEALLQPEKPPSGRSWASFRFVELSDDLPDDPAVKAIFDQYTQAIGRANLAAQQHKICPAVAPGELHYVGVASCRDCHAEAAAVWDGTRHPHAYQTLVAKSRQYDIECIRCHVLGYDQPGGVCRLDQVGALGGVQCEACHGMGSAHVDSAGGTDVPIPKPGIDQCLRCHTPDNDTRFSRDTYASHYLPGILGPGHGKPLPKK